MRRRMPWVLLAALAAGGAGWAAQGRSSDEQVIRRHIESIFEAFIEKDRVKLAATHGRDWRGYLTGSRTVIKGRDAYMRAAVGDGPMAPRGRSRSWTSTPARTATGSRSRRRRPIIPTISSAS